MLTSLLLGSAFASAALASADKGIPLDPPLPLAAQPWQATITAWDLPPQRAEYLTEQVEELRCQLQLDIQPDGSHSTTVLTCPETMADAALEATGRWSFAAAEAEQPTRARLDYVLRYNHSLGSLTLHAEIDPGAQAALAGVEGRPGLRLVHEASPVKPLERKLPRKARKAGLDTTTCHLRARVGTSGRVLETLVVECPEQLSADAAKRVSKARFSPTRVDGLRQEDVVEVDITYQR